MKSPWKGILIALVVLVAAAGLTIWSALYRVAKQPSWIASDQRDAYFYGSIEAGKTAGLPYWVWLAMPRIFQEHMPGPGGYAALGLSWEEGKEMPVGFAKQRVGYIRVTGNCALCHVISQSNGTGLGPDIVTAIPGRTTDLKPLLTFLRDCAADPRFNADEFFAEIDGDTKLSFFDRLLYRYVLIPRTRRSLMTDPAQVLFSPALQAHLRDPHSDAPFADPQMKPFREMLIQQTQPVEKKISFDR
jgi:hypothetical protein